MRTGTRPTHFQKVQHYAFISPQFFLTSLHSTPQFPGLQRAFKPAHGGPSGHCKRWRQGARSRRRVGRKVLPTRSSFQEGERRPGNQPAEEKGIVGKDKEGGPEVSLSPERMHRLPGETVQKALDQQRGSWENRETFLDFCLLSERRASPRNLLFIMTKIINSNSNSSPSETQTHAGSSGRMHLVLTTTGKVQPLFYLYPKGNQSTEKLRNLYKVTQ